MTPGDRHDFQDLIEDGTMPVKRRYLLKAVWEHILELERTVRLSHDALVSEGYTAENAGAGCAYGPWTAAHYLN